MGLGQSPCNPWAGYLTEILSYEVVFEKFSPDGGHEQARKGGKGGIERKHRAGDVELCGTGDDKGGERVLNDADGGSLDAQAAKHHDPAVEKPGSMPLLLQKNHTFLKRS